MAAWSVDFWQQKENLLLLVILNVLRGIPLQELLHMDLFPIYHAILAVNFK